MYSDKDNINILTALLVKHGIRHAVVCPGSRNAPIAHNLYECPDIKCYPVTDERSAGFYALGMAQHVKTPVVVCVTSGTAVLNLAPAVAEAYYQHVPIIVISADRPAAWIGQLAGQTLPQPGALGSFVRKVVSLPEPTNAEEWWHCNRLVNEVLLAATLDCGTLVHINVPITEPLFTFNVASLPNERVMKYLPTIEKPDCEEIINRLSTANRPMIMVGRLSDDALGGEKLLRLSRHVIVLKEALSPFTGEVTHFDEVLSTINNAPEYAPDFILYMGDTFVSKRLGKFLRKAKGTETYLISTDNEVHDPFMNTTGIIGNADLNDVIDELLAYYDSDNSERTDGQCAFHDMWQNALDGRKVITRDYAPAYSQMQVVRCFEAGLAKTNYKYDVQYGNSSAIRLANIYARHYVWCNRGVNGIDGSLSTAAGMSVASPDKLTFCVIGDLSFFYDQNALWNKHIDGNLRILLLNNGCGGIFHGLPGLEKSGALDEFVAAEHQTTAEGICLENNITYTKASNTLEAQSGIDALLRETSARPMLLEVRTDAKEDNKMIDEYYKMR